VLRNRRGCDIATAAGGLSYERMASLMLQFLDNFPAYG
jgi:hypothetical protein